MLDDNDYCAGDRGMAGLGQRGLEAGGGLGFLGGAAGGGGGAVRGLLAMSRGLPGGAVTCWLGVAILIFIQVDALEANQV